jgi:hypothetical protein
LRRTVSLGAAPATAPAAAVTTGTTADTNAATRAAAPPRPVRVEGARRAAVLASLRQPGVAAAAAKRQHQLARTAAESAAARQHGCPALLAGCRDAVGEALLLAHARAQAAQQEPPPVSAEVTTVEAIPSSPTAACFVPKPFRPTFTFKIGEPIGRNFHKKRTPSWPDRVLVRDLGLFFAAAQAHHRARESSSSPSELNSGSNSSGNAASAAGPTAAAAARRLIGTALLLCRPLPQVVCSDHTPVTAVFRPELPHGAFW